MAIKTILKTCLLILVVCNMAPAFAQSQYDGDMLGSFIGKDGESQEIKDLKSNYKCEMANQSHYLSKEGIELIFKSNALSEIHLYKSSAVYGEFKGKLPKGLKFGMASTDVKRIMGKPSLSYNTGYCEFEVQNYIISCWFEGSGLAQIGISLRTS